MTCKDCIHKELCVIIAFPEAFENTKWEKEPCDHFKNKADYVEVVRCKDCENKAGEVNQCGDVYCSLHQGWFYKDAFCSYGERKSGKDTNVLTK